MSINAYKPHLLVLPEDDANREMANGFLLDNRVLMCNMQVLPPAGGWKKALDSLQSKHAQGFLKYPERRLLLLIDFDDEVPARQAYVRDHIPAAMRHRVFVLGVCSEPERFRAACNQKLEAIGENLAKECAESRQDLWAHALLMHNEAELVRLETDVKPFLFQSN